MAATRAAPNDIWSSVWAAHNPNYIQVNQASVSNVATTQMLGLGATPSFLLLTPVQSTVVEFKVGGEVTVAATDSAQLIPSYGTSTAPTNGHATAGTQVGIGVNITMPTGPGTIPFWTEVLITGLTIGTTYWFDLEAVFGAGTLVVSNIVAIVREI